MEKKKLIISFVSGIIIASVVFSIIIFFIEQKVTRIENNSTESVKVTEEVVKKDEVEIIDDKKDKDVKITLEKEVEDKNEEVKQDKDKTSEDSEETSNESGLLENSEDDNNNENDNEKSVEEVIKELDDQIAAEYGDYNFSAEKTIELMGAFKGSETKEDIEKLLPYEHHWSATTSSVFVEHLDYDRLVDDCGDIEFNFKSKSYKESKGTGVSYINYNLTKKHCNESNFNSMYNDICSILGTPESDGFSDDLRVISWGEYELSTYDYNSWIRFSRKFSD